MSPSLLKEHQVPALRTSRLSIRTLVYSALLGLTACGPGPMDGDTKVTAIQPIGEDCEVLNNTPGEGAEVVCRIKEDAIVMRFLVKGVVGWQDQKDGFGKDSCIVQYLTDNIKVLDVGVPRPKIIVDGGQFYTPFLEHAAVLFSPEVPTQDGEFEVVCGDGAPFNVTMHGFQKN